jgi:hypothetical protein
MTGRWSVPWTPTWRSLLIVAGSVYALLSLWSLPWFPFVHSDEVWLASLTREMVETRSVAATEPFFEVTPRHPHAIKTLYHLIQAPFLLVSFSHLAARLPSLLAGLAIVGGVYLLLRNLGVPRGIALPVTAAAALDPAILAASHLGRQEALLAAVMVGGALAIHRARRPGVAAGVIVALAIFLHPNAFILSLALVPWLRRRPREILAYGAVVTVGAVIAVAASFAMDPNFVANYLAFGDSVGVTASPLTRLFGFHAFITKLVVRAAGTYYLPPVGTTFLVGTVAVVASVGIRLREWWRGRFSAGGSDGTDIPRAGAGRAGDKSSPVPTAPGPSARGRTTSAGTPPTTPAGSPPTTSAGTPPATPVGSLPTTSAGTPPATPVGSPSTTSGGTPPAKPALSLLATAIGIFLIGKYSPPIAVFFIPWIYLEAGLLLRWVGERGPGGRRIALAAGLCLLTASGVTLGVELARMHPSATGGDYAALSREVSDVLEEHGLAGRPVLANLNLGFLLEGEELLAFHDFSGLTGEEDPAAVVERRGIEVVIIPETEFDLIYRERPVWNDLYGNPTRFVPALRSLLEREGVRIGTIEAPVYGMRIVSRWNRDIPPVLGIYALVRGVPR